LRKIIVVILLFFTSISHAEIVWRNKVNLRVGPGLDRDVLLQLNEGTTVRVLKNQDPAFTYKICGVSVSDQWKKVRLPDGKTGWVFGGFLQKTPIQKGMFDGTLKNDAALYNAAGWSYFIGDIDDVRLYNRVLSDSEVAALYRE